MKMVYARIAGDVFPEDQQKSLSDNNAIDIILSSFCKHKENIFFDMPVCMILSNLLPEYKKLLTK